MRNLSDFGGHVGFVGAGNMATALLRGMIKGGLPEGRISAFDKEASKVDALVGELSITGSSSAEELVQASDVLIIALKPGVLPAALPPLRSVAAGKLWISVAAGVTTGSIAEFLGPCRIVRAMPNTPALVGVGATCLCAGAGAGAADLDLAELLFSGVGITQRVSEDQMDAVTGLSGSGPAFLMLAIEAMADGAVEAGLPRPIALRLAAQTVRGAGALVLESGLHPAELKDQVTSPGGTTIAGVAALEAGGLRGTLMDGVRAATARARALSKR